jgi:hypothetical protein
LTNTQLSLQRIGNLQQEQYGWNSMGILLKHVSLEQPGTSVPDAFPDDGAWAYTLGLGHNIWFVPGH